MDPAVLERTIKALEAALDSLGFWLAVFTALVVVGLLVEYAKDFKDLITGRPFNWELFRTVAGGVLITVGVAGELFIQFKASKVETDLRSANRKVEALLSADVASANARAKSAEAQVANANARIAEADAKAAEANEKAEQEHLARIKIEERMRGRGLLAEQENRIVIQISAFKGFEAHFGVTNETWEQVMLMRQLEIVFKRAEWSVSENQAEATGPLGVSATTGVLVRPLGGQRSFDTAMFVRNVLTAEKIRAHISTPNATNPNVSFPNPAPETATRLLIVVGDKPEIY